MTCYSIQPRDLIFLKSYGFLPFARNIGRNIGKNISKILSSKYSQKLVDRATKAHKTASKRRIQKTTVAMGDLIRIKIADKITRISKTSQINEEEILRERFISPEQRQKIIHDLRLI